MFLENLDEVKKFCKNKKKFDYVLSFNGRSTKFLVKFVSDDWIRVVALHRYSGGRWEVETCSFAPSWLTF